MRGRKHRIKREKRRKLPAEQYAALDALTVTAVIITVAAGFYGVYHKVASGKRLDMDHDPTTDAEVVEQADLGVDDIGHGDPGEPGSERDAGRGVQRGWAGRPVTSP